MYGIVSVSLYPNWYALLSGSNNHIIMCVWPSFTLNITICQFLWYRWVCLFTVITPKVMMVLTSYYMVTLLPSITGTLVWFPPQHADHANFSGLVSCEPKQSLDTNSRVARGRKWFPIPNMHSAWNFITYLQPFGKTESDMIFLAGENLYTDTYLHQKLFQLFT